MLRFLFLSILTLSLGLSQPAPLTARLDHAAQAYNQHRKFIGTVLVAKGGSILFEKGYGMANLELDVPNSPATKFRLGSITKQFTAAAVMQLQEKGALSVTDSACKYFDECPERWKQITIAQLLSHTSGIPSYTDDPEFAKPRMMRIPLTPREVLLLSKDKPLDFDPGTKWKYDNTGYIFLGVIVEKVSGEKYADYLQKHIFAPLGMKDSGYDNTHDILKNRAAGYQPTPTGFANADYLDMSLPYAAGSLYSTTHDLLLWDRALYSDQVLSKASRDQMFTPVKNDYGYGLMLAPMLNRKHIGHGGGINGFSTYLARFPDEDATVIVLSNNVAGNAQSVAMALAAELFGEKHDLPGERKEITLDAKLLDRYVGSYQVGPLLVEVTSEDGHLMIHPKGQPKTEAFAASDTKFFLKIVDADITFVLGADGKASEMKLDQGGAHLAGKRLP